MTAVQIIARVIASLIGMALAFGFTALGITLMIGAPTAIIGIAALLCVFIGLDLLYRVGFTIYEWLLGV